MAHIIWNKKKLTRDGKRIYRKDLKCHLYDTIEIGKGVTLRDFFGVLRSDFAFWDIVLQEYAMGALLDEAKGVKQSKKPWVKIVELCWRAELWDIKPHWDVDFLDKTMGKKNLKKTYHSGMNDFNVSLNVDGRRPKSKIGYGLALAPICQFIDAEIRIDKEVFLESWTGGKKTKRKESKMGHMDTTVLEFFKAIIFELTFHGVPEERNKCAKKLFEDIKDYKKGMKDGTLKIMKL